MVLPKAYGLQQGWPVASGQYAPPYSPPGSAPLLALSLDGSDASVVSLDGSDSFTLVLGAV